MMARRPTFISRYGLIVSRSGCRRGYGPGLVGNAVIVNLADGDQFGQFRRAAEVVNVKMGDDEVINFFETRRWLPVSNALRVASAGPAGINQDGLILRRDNQRRPAAFDINPINVERLVRHSGGAGKGQCKSQNKREEMLCLHR